ncbi:putative GIM3-Gim complex component [Thamnocephalis sphaerospora]|uniref:Prefoldin subunit 4 n=1 Tax=Thamnocephalis sphaerospora TaxID=78915 RepID=A0A4P9XU33_9FUNG|nr:putative GIM3-Gim complex component [Thamnocephalis sphaerospora]|eukprot:RKP09718.1 putative GIM3-Gim complex component [Thamnocephalis sphaerospora]
MRMLEKDEEADVEVKWEDQQRINEFSRLNNKVSDWEDQLSAKKQEKEYLEDLSGELELADEDEPVKYRLGEAFVAISLEDAQSRLEKEQDKLTEDIDALDTKMTEASERMAELKRLLYGKFGNAINLDK